MSKRFDVMSPRPGREEGKTFWHRVGTAFQSDKGGIGIYFDSLPIADKDGKVSVQLFEPKPRDGEKPAAATPSKSRAPAREDMDDEIPFR